ncbi:YegP family protein [Arthrobacter sp. KNU40]|uniref:YegP family protein n=1 Tax=Arthrobacter sp. KNU40 TaxID=3447965 RepID=UPI003F5FD8F3
MAGQFELFQDESGKHRFHLRSKEGEILASSVAFDSKNQAYEGIQSMRSIAATTNTIVLPMSFET